MKAVNPFVYHIPRELHEQYMTDFVTEYRKIHENTDDCSIPLKYGLIVAFARKSWKLQPSIGRYGQIWHTSEAQLLTTHPTTHANTSHKIVHSLLAWKKKHYMHTPNNVLNHTWISICVSFDSNYYSHRSSNWTWRVWAGYGRQCMCRGLHFFSMGKNLSIRDRVCLYIRE